jgi:hypothetical protein
MALSSHEIKRLKESYAVAKKWREILYRKTHDTTGMPVGGSSREMHQYMAWRRIEDADPFSKTPTAVDRGVEFQGYHNNLI